MAITGMTGMGDTQTEIAKMYQQYLGRQPDQGGLNYYSGVASSGGSMDSILQSIANSPEAKRFRASSSGDRQAGLLPNPTNPSIGNSGPVLGTTNAANPDYAAGQLGDAVGGIGNTAGMGQDINYNAPTTQALSVGDVFSTSIGDYQAVDNGFGQIGLQALDGAAKGPSDIIYNMAYDGNTIGVNPNTGEAWNQTSSGVLPGLTEVEQETMEAEPEWLSPAITSRGLPTTNTNVEEINALVNQMYLDYLGRDSELAGLNYWTQSVLDGSADLDDVRWNIANSPEGQAFAASSLTTDTNVTDDPDPGNPLNPVQPSMTQDEAVSYVTGLYQSILGRAPLQDGLDYWVNSLMAGATADDVRYNIFISPEFGGRANSEVSNYFTTLTGEAGDPSQIASYVGDAQSQAKSLDQIYQEIYNSDAAVAFRARQNNNSQPGSGNVGTGEQGSTQDARDDTETYEATQAEDSAAANAEDAQVATRTISPDELVENRINNLLASDNPYIERARTSGLQFANQRGLLNSSIAAQAAEEAAISRAGEIAAQDANTYAQAALANQQAQNTAGLQDAQLGTNVSMFNVGEENTTNRFNAQSVNEAGQFNAAAANQAIQNFLQREQVRLLQDDQQAFTAEQNEADRVLRKLLQDEQFDFTSSENNLDRTLQTALQENQFAFQGGQNALDRTLQTTLQDDQQSFQAAMQDDQQAFQTTMQDDQQAFQTTMQDDQQAFISIESALDRATQTLIADKEIAFRTWAQSNQQEWQTAQNALQLEFQYYNSNAQTATSIMYSTMEGVAQIYADPNLTAAQKQNAITNLLNSANSMPQLLSTIQANVTSIQQTNAATNYDDDGVWIGTGHPNWAVPPSDDQQYATVVTPIVNPNTGQIFMAPNAGWTYVGQTTAEGGGTGTDSGNSSTVTPNVLSQDQFIEQMTTQRGGGQVYYDGDILTKDEAYRRYLQSLRDAGVFPDVGGGP